MTALRLDQAQGEVMSWSQQIDSGHHEPAMRSWERARHDVYNQSTQVMAGKRVPRGRHGTCLFGGQLRKPSSYRLPTSSQSKVEYPAVPIY
jgi:hypothetical protein